MSTTSDRPRTSAAGRAEVHRAFAAAVREALARGGTRQKDLAERVGKSEVNISRYLSTPARLPRDWGLIERILEAAGADTATFAATYGAYWGIDGTVDRPLVLDAARVDPAGCEVGDDGAQSSDTDHPSGEPSSAESRAPVRARSSQLDGCADPVPIVDLVEVPAARAPDPSGQAVLRPDEPDEPDAATATDLSVVTDPTVTAPSASDRGDDRAPVGEALTAHAPVADASTEHAVAPDALDDPNVTEVDPLDSPTVAGPATPANPWPSGSTGAAVSSGQPASSPYDADTPPFGLPLADPANPVEPAGPPRSPTGRVNRTGCSGGS